MIESAEISLKGIIALISSATDKEDIDARVKAYSKV